MRMTPASTSAAKAALAHPKNASSAMPAASRPKPRIAGRARCDVTCRDRPLGPLARIELAIEGVVETHAADVEQRHGEQRPAVSTGTATPPARTSASQHVAPDRRQVGDAAELQRCAETHHAPSSERTHCELSCDVGRDIAVPQIGGQHVPSVGLDLEMGRDVPLAAEREHVAQRRPASTG